jgi:phage gpG-like protein
MARNKGGTESLKKKIDALNVLKTTMPKVLANDCVNFFKASFKKQGWDDQGLVKWKGRKNDVDPGRAILIGKGSGHLRQSIVVQSANWQKVVIVSQLPYSAIHNEGLDGKAFGKHNFKMPKRKFMGNSKKLISGMTKRLEVELNKVMKTK